VLMGIERSSMGYPRRCLGCRKSDKVENLLRCVARNNQVIVDELGKEPGRGAWVHRNQECISQSLKTRAWGRALRLEGKIQCSELETLSRSPDLAKTRLNG